MKKLFYAVGVGFVVVALAGQAWALGFRNPDQGAAATGSGEAWVATADDASAVWYNPGGMTQIRGTEVYFGSYLVLPQSKVVLSSPGAGTEHAEDNLAFLPQIYLVSDLGTEKWRFGLGINSPFGLSIDWGNAAFFRTIVTDAELRVINFNPSVAYQVTPQLSVGAGLDIYWSDTNLARGFAPFAALGGTDEFRFKGDGMALGYNVGVLWKINEQHRVGFTYRSQVELNYRGTETVRNNPFLALPNANAAPAQARVNFPQIVAAGYAFRPNAKLRLEVNVDWTCWDELDTLTLVSSAPPPAFPPVVAIPLNWKSSFFYEFGGEYQLNDAWTLRGGYIFSENSVPDATFSPLLPDSDRHILSAGVGFKRGAWTLNAVYQFSYSPERTVTTAPDPSGSGVYSTRANALSFSASWKF